MGQGQLGVERHDVVELVVGVAVLAVGVVQQALQAEVAERVLDQRHLAGDVDAVETCGLVGVLQDDELVVVVGTGVQEAPAGAAHGIDVVVDPGVERRDLEVPSDDRQRASRRWRRAYAPVSGFRSMSPT